MSNKRNVKGVIEAIKIEQGGDGSDWLPFAWWDKDKAWEWEIHGPGDIVQTRTNRAWVSM